MTASSPGTPPRGFEERTSVGPAPDDQPGLSITADDLVATSSGLAAGTIVGAGIGIAVSGPVIIPVGLGVLGLIAGGIVGRRLQANARH